MNLTSVKSIGELIHVEAGGRAAAIDAGTSLSTAVLGTAIDRTALPGKKMFQSVKVVATSYLDKLTTAKSFTLNGKLQHRSATSGAGSTWSNWGDTGATKTYSNSATSTAVATQVVLQFSRVLDGAAKYIRTVVSRAWNTTATGMTGDLQTTLIFGGASKNPATAS